VLGAAAVPAYALLHGVRREGGVGGESRFFLLFHLSESFLSAAVSFAFSSVRTLSLSFVSLVRTTSSWDRLGRRVKGSLQRAATARTADGKNGQNVHRHSLDRLYASMIKQKNPHIEHASSNWARVFPPFFCL